jgi:hypothetical protein
MAGHASGERFVLLEAATLRSLDLSAAAIGSTIKVMAQGLGDSIAVDAEAEFMARALRPLAPVHLHAARLMDATIRIGWIRRSRMGWAWLDGGDAPLGEEAERYRLAITPSVGLPRTVETALSAYDYTTGDQAIDGSGAAASATIAIAQLGSTGASLPPAIGTFDI